jgi:hypothetical protein
VSKFSELEAAAEWIYLVNQAECDFSAPWLRFLMETKNLSRSTTLLLALVIFDGYELFPAHDSDRKGNAAGDPERPGPI